MATPGKLRPIRPETINYARRERRSMHEAYLTQNIIIKTELKAILGQYELYTNRNT